MRPLKITGFALAGAAWLAAAGCLTFPWVPAEPAYTPRGKDYAVELPQGWMRWNRDEDDDVLVTRDGPALQVILIVRVRPEHTLKHTKKRLAKGMTPQEAAEVILDNYQSNPAYTAFEVAENRPVRISGRPGFRVVFTYRTKDGLKVRNVFCGVLKDDVLYGLAYSAPQRHYFDKDLRTFERVVQSFRLPQGV
ncbi:MAG TPA: hypothetical protein VNM66_06590 [Thermodesulfobacteriota bacterium]|nr:hypothetical protein [Thermodesulfobacteriota bacterium]